MKKINSYNLDFLRKERTGVNEAIFCLTKTKEQLLQILKEFDKKKISVIGTKCSVEQYNFLKKNKLNLNYDPISKIITLNKINKNKKIGSIAICCAGTSDIPIAEEVRITADFYNINTNCYYDIGVAGLHRLLSKIEDIKKNDLIIVVAGMEGALPTVIAGLVDVPIIAVPTSIGYGTSFNGITALLSMLNSCSEGISVVNIDNGYGAGIQAYKILKIKEKK